MKTHLYAFTLLGAFILLAQGVALAEMEEVLLREGTGGKAEVLSTTENSITVKFFMQGSEVQMKLMADRLDPLNFYEIRRRHMEDTADNHLRLAEYLIKNAQYRRAKQQIDIAEQLDPELVADMRKNPKIIEGIADMIYKNARSHYGAGEYDKAEEDVSLILTRFPETSVHKKAIPLLNLIERKAREATERKHEEELRKAEDAKEEAAKKAQEKMNKVLDPIYKRLDDGRKRQSAALRQRNRGRARDMLISAAQEFQLGMREAEKLAKKYADTPALASRLNELQSTLQSEAVDSYINAGGYELQVRSLNRAGELARKALLVDPNSQKAKSFLQQVQMAGAWGGRWGRR